MKKSLVILLMGVFVVSGIFITGNNKAQAKDKIDVLFFYGTGCGHCEAVKPTIKDFEVEYEDVVDVHWFDVYNDREASGLFNLYAIEYRMASRGVPTLIIGDKVLQGDTPIESGINSALLSCPGNCDLKVGVESALSEIRGDVVDTNVIDTSVDASIDASTSAEATVDRSTEPDQSDQAIDAQIDTGSDVPVVLEAGLTSEVNLTNKIVLAIIGAIALIGIAVFFVGKNKKDE